VTEGEILRLFAEYGELQEIYVMGGERSRSGQCSAFVKYATLEQCEKAISSVNQRARIRGTDPDAIVVKFAKPAAPGTKRERPETGFVMMPLPTVASLAPINSSPASEASGLGGVVKQHVHPPLCKLFIGGLPPFVDRDDLIATFAPCGHIDSVHLMQGKSKSGQACAFITYQYPGPAQKAIDTLSGKYVIDEDSPPISVRFADSESMPQKQRPTKIPKIGGSPVSYPRDPIEAASAAAASVFSNKGA
jgi:RNA recognition motif-containing protein